MQKIISGKSRQKGLLMQYTRKLELIPFQPYQ